MGESGEDLRRPERTGETETPPPERREALDEYRKLLVKSEPSAGDMKRLKVLLGRFGKPLKDATRDREILRQLADLQNRASKLAGAERGLHRAQVDAEAAKESVDDVEEKTTTTSGRVLGYQSLLETASGAQADLEGLRAGKAEQIRQLLGDAEFNRLGEEKARKLVSDLLD